MSEAGFFYVFIVGCLVLFVLLEYTYEAKPQKRHVDAGNIEQEILDRKKIRMLKRAKELKGQRLSFSRQNQLKKILPLYRKLPDSLKPKLEERILLFQEMVKFESHPKRSTEINQQTRDMVSAEACLLIIHRSPTDYLLLEYIELWSSKPKDWEGKSTPEVLLSGDHAKIKDWRLSQSEAITRRQRPDLWKKYLNKKNEKH